MLKAIVILFCTLSYFNSIVIERLLISIVIKVEEKLSVLCIVLLYVKIRLRNLIMFPKYPYLIFDGTVKSVYNGHPW